jgi:hypothetical protein
MKTLAETLMLDSFSNGELPRASSSLTYQYPAYALVRWSPIDIVFAHGGAALAPVCMLPSTSTIARTIAHAPSRTPSMLQIPNQPSSWASLYLSRSYALRTRLPLSVYACQPLQYHRVVRFSVFGSIGTMPDSKPGGYYLLCVGCFSPLCGGAGVTA